MKKKIKKSKGARLRVSPELKEKITADAKRLGLTCGEYILKMIRLDELKEKITADAKRLGLTPDEYILKKMILDEMLKMIASDEQLKKQADKHKSSKDFSYQYI